MIFKGGHFTMARQTLLIEGTNLIFRNFAGKESEYNKAGNRTTGVIIPENMVPQLVEEGWSVKQLPPRDPQDSPLYYMNAKIRFDNFPPKIYMCTSQKKTKLDEDTVDQIDYSEIQFVDIELSPYDYVVRGESGRSAYVKTLYVNVIEDAFAEKYNFGDVED